VGVCVGVVVGVGLLDRISGGTNVRDDVGVCDVDGAGGSGGSPPSTIGVTVLELLRVSLGVSLGVAGDEGVLDPLGVSLAVPVGVCDGKNAPPSTPDTSIPTAKPVTMTATASPDTVPPPPAITLLTNAHTRTHDHPPHPTPRQSPSLPRPFDNQSSPSVGRVNEVLPPLSGESQHRNPARVGLNRHGLVAAYVMLVQAMHSADTDGRGRCTCTYPLYR